MISPAHDELGNGKVRNVLSADFADMVFTVGNTETGTTVPINEYRTDMKSYSYWLLWIVKYYGKHCL